MLLRHLVGGLPVIIEVLIMVQIFGWTMLIVGAAMLASLIVGALMVWGLAGFGPILILGTPLLLLLEQLFADLIEGAY